MEHSQNDLRRSLRPPDSGRDDLLGEITRMLRLLSAQAKSKQELSRLAGSGGSLLRNGMNEQLHELISVSPKRFWHTVHDDADRGQYSRCASMAPPGS